MKLYRFLHRAENETQANMEKERRKGGKSAVAVLVRQLAAGEMYEFGEPWKLTSESLSAVVPILRRFHSDRKYLLIQEVSEKRLSVTDSGRINKLSVKLRGLKTPVFVRGGTIFEGQGTQSRTSGAGAIFDPEKENLVDVFCVHASHSISTHSGLSTMIDVVPRKVEDVLLSPQKSQRKVWNAAAVKGTRARVTQCPECNSSRLMQTYEAELVCIQCGTMISPTGKGRSAYNRRLTTMSGLDISDDLVANLDEMTRFNREVEKMLSKIPADLNNQTGIVIIDSGGVLGLEMFDHPDSWRAFSRSIVRNYVDVLAKERAAEHLFALRTERIPQAIRNFLKKAEKLSETSVLENRVGKTAMLSGELAGEYTIMGSELIHLILKRKTHVHAHASPRYLSWLSSRLFQNRF